MDKKWWQNSVVYQVYPRSFKDSNHDGIGDLNGIREKLPYIKALGADVIWISPIYKSPNDDNGYDISDYRAIMDAFGTMEDFDALLNEAHALGLRILMDLVVNHTSDEHEFFMESRSSRDNAKRDFYIWREPVDGHAPNNYGSAFSGSAWEFDDKTGMYYLHLFSKKQPDLNWDNKDVRDHVYDMMRFWLDKGIDGFRMDVISLISKDQTFPDGHAGPLGYADLDACANGKNVHKYIREMNDRVLSHYDIMTVGETACVDLENAKNYANIDGSELNMVFSFEHTSLDCCAETGKWVKKPLKLTDLKKNITKWQEGLYGIGWNSLYFCNHDQPRMVSRWGCDSAAYRERSAKMLGCFLHFLQGTPYIYQGEELGMKNMPFTDISQYRDIEAINAYHDLVDNDIMTPEDAFEAVNYKSRDNARTPMQWDDTEYAGFSDTTPWICVNPSYKEINAKEQISRPDSVFNFYKKLIAIRHESDTVKFGRYTLLDPDHEDIYIYKRTLEDDTLICVCNFSDKEIDYTLPLPIKEMLIANCEDRKDSSLPVRPYEAFAYRA